jgi:PAS domain S-box-containing protein
MKINKRSAAWQFMQNLLYAGIDPFNESIDFEYRFRILLLNISYLIGIVFLIPFGFNALLLGKYPLFVMDWTVALIMVLSVIYMRKKKKIKWPKVITLISISLLFWYLFVSGGVFNSGHLWLFIYPLFVLFIFGTKTGSAVVLAFAAILVQSQIFPLFSWQTDHYSNSFLLRLISGYLIIYSLTLYYSIVQKKTESRIAEKNKTLSRIVNTLSLTQNELSNREHLLKSTLESSQEGILVINTAGDFILYNTRFLEMWGIAPAMLITENYLAVIEFMESCIEPLSKNHLRFQNLDAHKKKDWGKLTLKNNHILESYSAPLIQKEELTGWVISFKDVTERENALLQKQKLEKQMQIHKKMEALGMLAGSVAHDLNNILSAVVSYPDLLLLNKNLDEKMRKSLELIQESGQRATAIVSDLLTVTRGIAGSRFPVNLNHIIQDYLQSPEFLKLTQFHPQVKIELNLHEALKNIQASEIHLKKVVMNLISNAAEAIGSNQPGLVKISTGITLLDRIFIGFEKINPGTYTTLSISDNGPGIETNELERVFEPFYSKKVMGRSGTGLGLTVVWNSVHDHNGFIDLTSNGHGTHFTLYFPVTDEPLPPADDLLETELQGNGESILIVDDVSIQRSISEEIVKSLGYQVQCAASGEAAIEFIKKTTIDLLIIDMIMDPGIDGLETFRTIKQIQPTIKAIITSGYTETDRVKKAIQLGVGGFLKKPYTLKELGKALKIQFKK